MGLSVLISDPDKKWTKETEKYLEEKRYSTDYAISGKDCQLKLYAKKYTSVVLDVDTQNHSGFEVLRYLRLNHPSIKVILTFKDKKRLKELELKEDELKKLGASDILVKPFSFERLLKSIEGVNQFEAWKNITQSNHEHDEVEVSISDDQFTKIKISDFYSGNMSIFDYYIKLGQNRYVKILHKGDAFNENRFKKYSTEKKVDYLYFKTKDRGAYINFINDVLLKISKSNKVSASKKIKIAKNLSEKFVEEIYTVGLKPQLVEEGEKACLGILNSIDRDIKVKELLEAFDTERPTEGQHSFHVAFMSSVICQNLEWATHRSNNIIIMGALLHDIGMLKLPPRISDMNEEDLSEKDLEMYQQHPVLGAKLLQKYETISEPVRQIVYQHHEFVNGTGFPNSLGHNRIYPLAKVVSFAEDFCQYIRANKISPLEGIKVLIQDRFWLEKFDPDVIRALAQAFIKGQKK